MLAAICGRTTNNTIHRNGRRRIGAKIVGTRGNCRSASRSRRQPSSWSASSAQLAKRSAGFGSRQRPIVRSNVMRAEGRPGLQTGAACRRSSDIAQGVGHFSFAPDDGKTHAAIEHLVEHEAERIHVGTSGDGLVAGVIGGIEGVQVFGRHVGERAAEHFFAAGFGADGLGRDVEIGEHRPAIGIDENIRRLDVAVQDAVAVGEIERFG